MVLFISTLRAEIDAGFSNKVEKEVAAVYYSAKISDSERVPLTQKKLAGFVESKSVDDRRGAAFTLGEMSTLLDREFVRTMFAKQLQDEDAGVRFLALMECGTCTGYPETLVGSFRDLLKAACRDENLKVRELAKGTYRYAQKILKLEKRNGSR